MSPVAEETPPEESHPVRGAWIEMCRSKAISPYGASHPVRGAWIEIPLKSISRIVVFRRTPSGVRGLKCTSAYDEKGRRRSHPVRGAWIEIQLCLAVYLFNESHPVRGAWIEIKN